MAQIRNSNVYVNHNYLSSTMPTCNGGINSISFGNGCSDIEFTTQRFAEENCPKWSKDPIMGWAHNCESSGKKDDGWFGSGNWTCQNGEQCRPWRSPRRPHY